MRKAITAVIAGLSFLGMFQNADAFGWSQRYYPRGIVTVPPTWIPPQCYQYGPCEPVVSYTRTSIQLKVRTPNYLMTFGYEYRPPLSEDGRTWACVDTRTQMAPFWPVFQGRCLFIGRTFGIQRLEPMK